MSPILHAIVTTVGGILAGLALAGALLWRQQQALEAARYDATHDDVTGLPNRRFLLTRLRAALTDGAPCGVVLLDLDRFKTVNDTFGHDTGNVLLAQVGRLIAGLDAPVEVAARLSGDEFALLVRGDQDDTAAAARAAWRAIGAAPIGLDTGEISIRASVGYTHTHLQTSPRQLLAEADEAMYHAKRSATGVCGHHPLTTPPGRRSRDRHHR
ncbi:GGDEF domain-containing protein [Micromonospora sp. 4G57]|uniref:GGDEF domain-containing protein n=1 Tax=Micromonospora sicca TaxID=2202420 RepID=A0ABU5JLK5_9ACTN|nr:MULTISPECIES: GGDEF domain-containing protein [unclassified Micromonospora]MDZ5446765.1 GGDEF domain-containing protein [Micromonospora sp. 4G57]MDZ5493500.1 GGDEF domain-containing protein [Micromonospora sp. 4G53]